MQLAHRCVLYPMHACLCSCTCRAYRCRALASSARSLKHLNTHRSRDPNSVGRRCARTARLVSDCKSSSPRVVRPRSGIVCVCVCVRAHTHTHSLTHVCVFILCNCVPERCGRSVCMREPRALRSHTRTHTGTTGLLPLCEYNTVCVEAEECQGCSSWRFRRLV